MTRWYTEKKKEHYYKKAKHVGYRSRSAFKLQQIQIRFHLIPKNGIVVDLGAAPGGWSQVAKEFVGKKGTVIGADLSLIQPIESIQFLQGDITESETIEQIKILLNGKKVDVVMSDMSPNISGNYSVDQARSVWLCKCSLHVVDKILRKKGHFICKIFEGEDTKKFIELVKKRFKTVKTFSPQASRKSSSELYIIAKQYKDSYINSNNSFE